MPAAPWAIMTLHIYMHAASSQQQQLEKLQMDHGWMVITD